MGNKRKKADEIQLIKCPTGIDGFDGIVGGGLPAGRPTLVCGNAGCGKTLFAMEFLVKGATLYREPGVFIAFEENEAELAANVASLGWDLADLVKQKKIFLDHVYIERSEIEETGEFNLDGLFIRIESAVRAFSAGRIVIDTIEALFSGFSNEALLRAEIRRLFRWIKDKGLTAVITGEQGAGILTRSGLEEYVSDCVIFLDHRMNDQIREFLLTDDGIQLIDVYSGSGGVLNRHGPRHPGVDRDGPEAGAKDENQAPAAGSAAKASQHGKPPAGNQGCLCLGKRGYCQCHC